MRIYKKPLIEPRVAGALEKLRILSKYASVVDVSVVGGDNGC